MKFFGARIPILFSIVFTLLIGWLPVSRAAADSSVTGVIRGIDLRRSHLAFDAGSGVVDLLVPAYAWITVDAVDCGINNLRIGEKARTVIYNAPVGPVAMRVDAQSPGKKRILKGVLAGFPSAGVLSLLDQNGKPGDPPLPVSVDGATIYVRNGLDAAGSDLLVSDRLVVVALIQADGSLLANYVEASAPLDKRPIIVSGIVKSIAGRAIVIKTWTVGIEETLNADPSSTGIVRNRKAVRASDLRVGDQVMAYGVRNATGAIDALMISAQSPDIEWAGTISDVNASEGWAIVTPTQAGPPLKLLVYPATVIQVNGRDADLGDVRPGDKVTIRAIIVFDAPWSTLYLAISR